MQTNVKLSPQENTVATGVFMPRLFDETMALLVETRNYFLAKSKPDQDSLTNNAKLVYATEMSRISLRLSSVMAWVLARRAALAGEITQEQLKENFMLQFKDTCNFELPHGHMVLPQAVCDLLTRSRALYARISRLELLEA
jgi:regulator of CtrA degradation